ncbi:MAG: CBS domain-containing protein [Gammaproteobacteria bacterium]|nr:CBS domain-containing protein [Gammaproteobacteria bacterium]HXK55790.1 CBS domain-containing protein [Gammaproteobacteria bacterium]
MTCSTAMFTKFFSAKPDDTVGDALNLLTEHGIRSVPVLDDEGRLMGFFHFRRLLAQLLPVTGETDWSGHATHRGLIDRDIKFTSIIGSSAELRAGNHLHTMLSLKLREVTDTDFEMAHPDTPLLETIRLLIKYRGPLPVVNNGENKLIALVTVQSMMQALERIAAEH